MPSRDSLHRLVDDLPDSEINRAERVLQVLKETAETLYGLEDAPEDDELESADEAAAVSEAWQEHAAGKGLTTEKVKRRLGLS